MYVKRLTSGYRLITKSGGITNPVSVSKLCANEYVGQRYGGINMYDSYSSYDLYGGGSCPSAEQLGFNSSQYDAFKMALTKEFVIIQGTSASIYYIYIY